MRVILGYIFTMHGFAIPDSGIRDAEAWFASQGVPSVLAIFVSAVEICGGFMLMTGLLTRWCSYSLIFVLLGALLFGKTDTAVLAHAPMAVSYVIWGYLAGLLYFAITGETGYAWDMLLKGKKHEESA